jgi:cytoplasmic iron level regulating protein YaaA (DUF328/UPF0246 family)
MHISEELAIQNYDRYQSWKRPKELTSVTQPCSFIFNGEVYKALDVCSLDPKELTYAQEHLFILSGLYGLLRPLDVIYPYRLEMGTKWSPDTKNKNLYTFWRDKLTSHLLSSINKDETIVNLASTEYSKVIDWKKITNRSITPIFKEFKNGEFKVIMMYAKHARGAMARYLIQNRMKKIEQLKLYNLDGYVYDDRLSSEREWVFVR